MASDVQKLYDNRFKDKDKQRKRAMWREICKYFASITHGEYKTVVDVAAGYCDFINNIDFDCKKYAIDVNPDVKKYADEDVTAFTDNIENLSSHFKEGSVSLFFMSNFLEHIPKDTITRLLETEYSLLEKGGEVWITPITDKALIEAAELIGYQVKKCIPKLLPYTTKSALPQAAWIVGLYLKLMPFSGMVFGEQSFLVLAK